MEPGITDYVFITKNINPDITILHSTPPWGVELCLTLQHAYCTCKCTISSWRPLTVCTKERMILNKCELELIGRVIYFLSCVYYTENL